MHPPENLAACDLQSHKTSQAKHSKKRQGRERDLNLKKNFIVSPHVGSTTGTVPVFMCTSAVQARGALVMYCSVQEEWCRAITGGRVGNL